MQALLKENLGPHIVKLTLNRPEGANALNIQLAKEIAASFADIGQARVVLLTGAGKNFCAGADLKEREGMDASAWKVQHDALESALHALLHCPVPVIAMVQGAAYAGGLELALACDFIVAANNARFALTEASLGIMPGLGGTQALPRAIGQRAAKEMLYTASPISAERALTLGLINSLHALEALEPSTIQLAQKIAGNAPLSLKAIKAAIHVGESLPIEAAMAKELEYYQVLIHSQDRIEGNRAFLEKRKPIFEGK